VGEKRGGGGKGGRALCLRGGEKRDVSIKTLRKKGDTRAERGKKLHSRSDFPNTRGKKRGAKKKGNRNHNLFRKEQGPGKKIKRGRVNQKKRGSKNHGLF